MSTADKFMCPGIACFAAWMFTGNPLLAIAGLVLCFIGASHT